jgi:hypothetical protein
MEGHCLTGQSLLLAVEPMEEEEWQEEADIYCKTILNYLLFCLVDILSCCKNMQEHKETATQLFCLLQCKQ